MVNYVHFVLVVLFWKWNSNWEKMHYVSKIICFASSIMFNHQQHTSIKFICSTLLINVVNNAPLTAKTRCFVTVLS